MTKDFDRAGHLLRGLAILVNGVSGKMGLLVNEMRGDVSMNLSRAKRAVTGAAFALVFLFSVGILTGTTAQAQDRDRNNRWDRNQRGDRTRAGDWNRQQTERAREIERARQLALQRERERSRYVYTSPRTYPYGAYQNGGYQNGGYQYGGYQNGGYANSGYQNGGYRNGGGYGGYGGGSNNGEVQRGYYDGLNRGQEDSRDRRSFNPNNSSHYRSGNAAYRQGFRQGYQAGYRQYGGNRRR
jgi:hypothetical protein